MQRFVESARVALVDLRSRLLIGSISLLMAAGCSTITPPENEGQESLAGATAVTNPGAGTREAAPREAVVDASSQASIATAGTQPPDRPQWTGRNDNGAPGSLWDRIRAGFAMPELDTSLVAQKERFYLSKPDYLQRMFSRGGRYLFHIVEEIEKRGMPTELALLPFVESAMNPEALSHAQAAGLWQFIPSTGKAYNLDQNWWVDNRRDVVKSTEAALDYLQRIYEMHGNDWFLALASYNWGEGAVGRAVKRNKARGLPTDYLSLQMPNETRHYVPKLIALKHIVQRASELGVQLPDLPNRPYFVTIEKTRPIDLKLAARFAGMTVPEFVALNPAHNRPVIAASRNNEIKLPADRVDAFLDAVESHGQSNRAFATWQPYTMKAGDSLEALASRGNVTVAELREANDLRPGQRILPGTRILSPHREVEDETRVENFDGPRVYELVERPAVYHVVRPRESLGSIAQRYGTTVSSLRSLNGLKTATAPQGSRLLVRPASSQTMLTTESGDRRVVAQGEPRVMRAVLREEVQAPAPAPAPAAGGDRAEPATPKAESKAGTKGTTKAGKAAPRAAAKSPARSGGGTKKADKAEKADRDQKASGRPAAEGRGVVHTSKTPANQRPVDKRT